jgi:hypothetical protein
MTSTPINQKLYDSIKKKANKKFESKTGIYRSSWIVKEYLKAGGKYKGKKDEKKGLKRWFKEGWVDLNRPIKNSKGKVVGYKKCGRKSITKGKYPLCRPSKRVNSETPKTYKEISKKSIKKAKKQKSKVRGTRNIKFGAGDTNNQNIKDNIILSVVAVITFGLMSILVK